jgi:endonuclease/exonuclease/phosphatase family metal-dependent hydrolase
MPSLRVMTINLASGSGEPYVDFTVAKHAEYINSRTPDLLCLQEVDRGTWRASGVDQFERLKQLTQMRGGQFVGDALEGGEYGLAALTRSPDAGHRGELADGFTSGVFGVGYKGYRFPWAGFEVEHRLVTAISIHATGFAKDPELAIFTGRSVADKLWSTTNIVAGDFNSGLDDPPLLPIQAKLQAAERAAAAADRQIDRRRCAGPPDMDPIDHILVGSAFRVDRFTIEQALTPSGQCFSDHNIVWADLTFEPGTPPTRPSPCDRLRANISALREKLRQAQRRRDRWGAGEVPPELDAEIEALEARLQEATDRARQEGCL